MLQSIIYRLTSLRKLIVLMSIFLFIGFVMNITLLLGGYKPGALEYANMLTVSFTKR